MKRFLVVFALAPAMSFLASAQTFGYNKPALDRNGKPLPPRPCRAPDMPLGAGPYKAVMSEMPRLSAHVAYFPANLAALAPVFYAWKTGLDHIGAFAEPDGGELGKIAPAWLDWAFRHDTTAAKIFEGADCTLCQDPSWHVARKNLP